MEDDEESDFNVDSLFNLDAMNEDGDFYVDSYLNLDAMNEDGDFINVDSYLNLEVIAEEISVEALLEEVAAAAQPRQDPAPLVDTHTVPNAQVFPDLQAAASDYVLIPSQVLAPPPVQHQQTLGEASGYGFDDQMMTQVPIDQVRRADHVQQHQAPIQQMMMPAPVANVQTNTQAVPSDQVQETDVLLQQFLGEPMWAFNFHDFDDEMPMMASGGGEEFSGPPSPADSLEMHQYFEQNSYYDIADALISDDEDQAGSGGANGVPDVDEPMEGEWFLPFEPGRLQCDNCRVVRQIRVQYETHDDFIRLHSATDGTFEHAIIDRKYTYVDADEQAPMAERLYMDFSRRTGEWVLYVMGQIVRSLRNEMTATVEDSDEAVNMAPVGNDAYQIMEIEMLKAIDSTPENVEMRVPSPPPAQPVLVPSPPPAAQPAPVPPAVQTALAMEIAANANLSVLSLEKMIQPEIFESWPFVREEQSSESARVDVTRPLERVASSSDEEKEEEIRQYLHELKEKAQRELDTRTPLLVKRFCRKMKWTWMLDLIKRNNKNIIKLEKKTSHLRLSGLLAIRDTGDKYVAEKEKLRNDITVGMNEEMESNASYRVGKNDHEAGPSRAKKGGALQ
ncbi:unnamed protein product [Alopecurus aequalis]